MKASAKKLIAVVSGIAVFALCAVLAVLTGFLVSGAIGGPAGSVIPDNVAVYARQYGSAYFQLSFLGLSFVAGEIDARLCTDSCAANPSESPGRWSITQCVEDSLL
jgi:hypothetical protein